MTFWKGDDSDLQQLGDKKSRLESPGDWVTLFFFPKQKQRRESGGWVLLVGVDVRKGQMWFHHFGVVTKETGPCTPPPNKRNPTPGKIKPFTLGRS